MIIKYNNEVIYQRVLGAITNMTRNPNDAVFGFVLISIPIVIDVDDKYEKHIIFTDGRGIKLQGNTKEIITILDQLSTDKVLKHELEHILLNHIYRAKDLIGIHKDIPENYLMTLINIAQDYIINKDIGLSEYTGFNGERIRLIGDEYMKVLFGFKPEDLEKKSFEEIVEMMIKVKGKEINDLKQLIEDIKKLVKEGYFSYNDMNNHTKNENEKDFDDFIKKNTEKFGNDFKKYLTNILKEAITNYGTGNSGVWKKIDNIYGKPVLNWKTILYNEIKSYKSREISENGINEVNRRYYVLSKFNKNIPIIFQKHKRIFKDGLIAIDTSGSIDDKKYISEINEVINLIKSEVGEWKILLFDDGIEKDKDGKPIIFTTAGKSIKTIYDILSKRTYGGTNIKEVLDYANSNKVKFLILISDMVFSYNLPEYKNFRKIFISTKSKIDTSEDVGKIADVVAYMG